MPNERATDAIRPRCHVGIGVPFRVAPHVAAFLALLGLGLAVYYPVIDLLPLGGDNLYTLAWVDQATVGGLFGLDPAIYPEWRPLAYQTVWLEHSILQLRQVAVHHLVNLMLWVVCAWLVYRLVEVVGGSRGWAFAVAVLLLIDERAVDSLTWIVERQTTLACALGLVACLIVVRERSAALTRRHAVVVAALLLAAALSKEFGLAFAAAMACHACARRDRILALSSLSAVLVYGILRVSLAGGAIGTYCEEMGYFFEVRLQCVLPVTAAGAGQMGYNAIANGIGLALPGVFDVDGRIRLAPATLALGAPLLAAAAWGFRFASAPVRMLALVAVFNALLGAMIYRGRNQLVGLCALSVVIGVGFSMWPRLAMPRRQALRLAALFAVVVAAAAGRQAIATHRNVASDVAAKLARDPCDSALRARAFADRFAKRIKSTYDMANPDCQETPSAD